MEREAVVVICKKCYGVANLAWEEITKLLKGTGIDVDPVADGYPMPPGIKAREFVWRKKPVDFEQFRPDDEIEVVVQAMMAVLEEDRGESKRLLVRKPLDIIPAIPNEEDKRSGYVAYMLGAWG